MDISHTKVDAVVPALMPTAGESKPISVIASNNKKYMLKNEVVTIKGVIQNEDSVFMQELFVTQIAEKLQIPVPSVAILEITDEFINANRDFLFRYKMKPGLYFGSEVLPNIEDNLVKNYKLAEQVGKPYVVKSWNSFFKNISNPEIYASIIALDLLTVNHDRFNNEGNILLTNKNNLRKVYAIDFGHSFLGPSWYANEKQTLFKQVPNDPKQYPSFAKIIVWGSKELELSGIISQAALGRIFRGLENNIDLSNPDNNPFLSIVNKIENLADSEIANMLNNVPTAWIPGKDLQKSAYYNFVINNKNIVRYYINELNKSGAFSNSRGGDLTWTNNKEKITGIQ